MQISSSHFISLAILWNSKWKETEEISNIFLKARSEMVTIKEHKI